MSKRIRRIYWTAFLLVAAGLAPTASAQSATVTGTVVDFSGSPLAGVSVSVDGTTVLSGPGGGFSAIVGTGVADIEFAPPVTYVAPLILRDVLISSSLNLGQVMLPQGFTLSGTVLNPAGLPVVGADTNVYDMATGVKLFTPMDNTDLSGVFSVVVPAGNYRLRVSPPPVLSLVAREIENVGVNGAVSVGTVSLVAGVQLTGTVVNAVTLAPLDNVDLDVDDVFTGARIVTPGDDTDATGAFSVVVPAGLFHISFEPSAGALAVARELYNVSTFGGAPVSLGTIALQPGVLLSGSVIDAAGQPASNVDIDVDTSLGGVRILTPRDNTDAAGGFSVVVPVGTYDITYEPPFSASLVGARQLSVSVSGATTLPIQQLQAGVVLSGTVIGAFGAPEFGCDVDVMDPNTGEELVSPGDDSDAAGAYQVLVPGGTWDLRFQTRKASPSMDQTVTGVVVTGATIQNVNLPLVPAGLAILTVGIPTVSPGGFLPMDLFMLNPGFASLSVQGSLVMIDPAGVETTIVAPITLALPSQQLFVIPGFPITVPSGISPSLLGLPFRFEARFEDPTTGARIDTDHITAVVQ